MTWKPNVTVAALIESSGRFLLVQERDADRVVLNQPAGHLEPGESLVTAAVRETLEETGRAFNPQGIVGVYRYQNTGNGITYLRFCFCGEAADPEVGRRLDPDIVTTLWLSPADLETRRPELRSPMVMRCIHDYLAGRRYPLELLGELDPNTA